MIPIYIQLLAKLIPILKYDSTEEKNLSQGEIKKFNFIESCRNKYGFNKQVLSFEDGYDWIWRHISDDYFKCIGKWHERTC